MKKVIFFFSFLAFVLCIGIDTQAQSKRQQRRTARQTKKNLDSTVAAVVKPNTTTLRDVHIPKGYPIVVSDSALVGGTMLYTIGIPKGQCKALKHTLVDLIKKLQTTPIIISIDKDDEIRVSAPPASGNP